MGKFITMSLLSLLLVSCAGNQNNISVVNADDTALNCKQIEQEINHLRKERKDTLNNVFYTNRNIVDATTQRIRYLKTMHSYNRCSEGNPKYTKVVIASL